ncbi:MAG TPA: serine hydrolase domain-containing protein [Vicinamibacterales bacterium]|nr:serine hydrolase domain-containing protein [Vicinamibacterales bacterium]
MRASFRVLGVVTAFMAVLSSAVPAQQLLASGSLTVFDAYLESLRQQAGIPGMSAAIVKDGAIVWEKGYGFQNVATRLRATPDTPYVIGDVAESFAAVLLLQCVEQRRLQLDTPVSRYGVAGLEPEATMRQLLSHAAPAGVDEQFQFNRARFDTLTTVAEWCIPQPYRKSISHRLLDRLAMTRSVPGTDLRDPDFTLPDGLYTDDEVAHYRDVLTNLATPYHLAKSRAEPTEIPALTMSAANGLVSTVRDLAQFDAALDSEILLLGDTREQAWTNAAGRDGAVLPTGLGWFVQPYRNERVVWQFGIIPGAYSSLVIKVPARNVTFILLANSDGLVAPYDLAQGDLTRSVFANLFLRLAI